MIVSQALRAAVAQLSSAGVPDAARDARRLLAHALEISPDRLTLEMPSDMPEDVHLRFQEAIAARCQRQPVSHIIGTRDFWGRTFRVTGDVLDPRPETELIVELALAGPTPERIIDLGTGSGALICTLLAEFPDAKGIATDISGAALAVARQNAEDQGVSDRVTFMQANWWAGVDACFDLVVSNPPYIAQAEMSALKPELSWEPEMALSPGGDGLAAYRALADGLCAHARSGARGLFEIGASQAGDVATIFQHYGLADTTVHKDLDQRDRVVEIRQLA